jgi:Zn-dependent protease with chaperone function
MSSMLMIRLIFITVFLLQTCEIANAQYIPLKNDVTSRLEYLESIGKRFEEDKKTIKRSGAPYRKELLAMYEMRWMANVNRANEGHYVFDTRWELYLDVLKDEISRNNLNYDLTEVNVVLGRYDVPNAFSVGDGTIVINIGLVPFLENEDQLVFILCHEFSHYLLQHSNNRMREALTGKHAEQLKTRLEGISASEYYQVSKLKELIRENLYFERQNSRLLELEADSLGLLLYLNTRYAPRQAAQTMLVLDSIAEEPLGSQIPIFQYLDAKEVQLESSSFIDGGPKKPGDLDDDSIASHPEMMLRYNRLERMIREKEVKAQTQNNASQGFTDFLYAMHHEYAESLMAFKHYDKAFLYCIRQLETEPESDYFKSTAVYSLYRLYEARKNHNTGNCTSTPIENDSSHIQLIHYLFASRLSHFAADAYAYCNGFTDADTKDERLLFCMLMLAKANNDKVIFEKFRNKYLKLYPQGTYINEIPKT